MATFRLHRLVAVAVLVAAATWIGTGEFAMVGSHSAAEPAAAAPPPPPPPEPATRLRTVGAIDPQFFDHAREIRIAGVTAPDKHSVLAARSNGIIDRLSLAKGQKIAAGDVVMTLEGPDLEAALTIAQVSLDQARRELDVAEKLRQRGSMPELQFTAARSKMLSAEAELARAQAAVDQRQVVAPFDALVDSVGVERGEWVQVGTAVATILSLDPIVVLAEVSEIDIAHVAPGAKAEVHLVTGQKMQGAVRFVAKDASSNTRTYRIEVALPNPDDSIPSGMTADLRLFTDPVRAVKVPRSVITLSDAGELGLRVVGPDNIAHFLPARLIDDTPEGLILGDVPDGVRIIVAGQDLVREGEQVEVVLQPATAGAGE